MASSTQIKKKEEKSGTVSFWGLFRFASLSQKCMVFVAIFLGLAHGMMTPLNSVVFGKISKDFTPDKTPDQIKQVAMKSSLTMIALGVVSMILSSSGIGLWTFLGASVTSNIRKKYFEKILEQDVGWFDLQNPETLSTKYNY